MGRDFSTMEDTRTAYKIFVRNLKGIDDLDVNGRIVLK
jgi:hypothetical protein